MEPKQIAKLRLRTPIWVWIVRMGTGRWWPGRVESISLQDHLPLLKVRFEYQTFRNDKRYGPPVIGITTARMRHVELRDPDLKALDLPRCAPTPLMEKEERPDPNLLATSELADELAPIQAKRRILRRPTNDSLLARFARRFEISD